MASADIINCMTEQFEKAAILDDGEEKIKIYQEVIKGFAQYDNEELVRIKEGCITELAKQYHKQDGGAKKLANLIRECRQFLPSLSKAKAAKIVKILIELYLEMGKSEHHKLEAVDICKECIVWAKDEQRTYLRQNLEARLVSQYYEVRMYDDAIKLANNLLKELKKLDDKNLLVELQLLESRIYYALSNIQRSKAALTSARTTANAIYCPPKLQASLDLQSGVLHAQEKDFKTAFSYFYEAFEGYDSVDHHLALPSLKYMLLCKIMLSHPEDVNGIVSGKLALKYVGKQIDALKSVADASTKRSLADFNVVKVNYKEELLNDVIIKEHLGQLYDTMLEQNLCRIIEPFSRVQISHIAELINLDQDLVEKKLSQMILDAKFSGILDQGEGILIVFEQDEKDKTYTHALSTLHHMNKVVDSLFKIAKKLK